MHVPETRYARNGDVFLAYQVLGEGPIDLVMIPPGASHLEHWWTLQGTGSWLRQLASFSRLIIFDKRGNGLSDRRGGTASMDERVDDLRAVMDAAGSERAVLYGVSEGGPMSIVFAAAHPDRTLGLVLYSTGARFAPDVDYEVSPMWQRPRSAPSVDWNTPESTTQFLRVFAPSVADDPQIVESFARMMRNAMGPGDSVAASEFVRGIDVRPVLPLVDVPTLVIHHSGDRVKLLTEGEFLATNIAGARLVVLPGEDHIAVLAGARSAVIPVEEFLGELVARDLTDRVLATVMFTDIVGSTQHAVAVGDASWRSLLDRHDEAIRKEIDRFRGRLVKTTGDGVLAVFDGPARAVRAGLGIVEAARRLGVDVQVGVHTGEVELRGDDIGGVAVHVAARIMKTSAAGEVAVSMTLRDLVAGSGLHFADRGEHELKGFPGTWSLFAAT